MIQTTIEPQMPGKSPDTPNNTPPLPNAPTRPEPNDLPEHDIQAGGFRERDKEDQPSSEIPERKDRADIELPTTEDQNNEKHMDDGSLI